MIAVDAMGGDFAPHSAVQAAIQVAHKHIKVGLYGDQVQLFSLLYEYDLNWEKLPIEVIHCSQVIEMTDVASLSILRKHDSSLVRALTDVAEGKAQAVVTAGHSGAALAGGTIILGKIPGIDRPAIGNMFPTLQSHGIFCIDLGANVDCKPEQMVQFATMGHVYTKMLYHIATPRIGLLSNGHEPYKGSPLVKQAYGLLESSSVLNFVGNIEPTELFFGSADVLVSDGFAGNIMLKTVEGTAAAFKTMLQQQLQQSWWRRIACKGLGRSLTSFLDYEKQGGALLLGVRHPLVVAHGCSQASTLAQAIMFAHKKAKTSFVERFAQQVTHCLEQHDQMAQTAAKKLHSLSNFDKNV